MNTPSSFTGLQFLCSARDRLLMRSLATLLIALALVSVEGRAQTYAQRLSLISSLNNAMVSLMLAATADPDDPHNVTVAIPIGITIKGYDGECGAPTSIKLEYEPHIEPGNLSSPAGVRLVVVLRNAGEMDIPEFAHNFVCQLNTMMWHLLNGNYQRNWIVDEDDNIIITPRNYDANCTPATTQKFWMIDEDVIYDPGPPIVKMNPEYPGGMWLPTQTNDARLWNIADPNPVNHFEEGGTIYGYDFVKAGNAGKQIWIVRRHEANDGRMDIRRGYTKAVFDFDYYDRSGPIPVLSTDQEYIDPFHDPAWGYDKKLTAIELIARIHKYSPDDCPQTTNPAAQPLSDRSELEMIVHYEDDMGVSCSTSCVESWQAVPANPDLDNQNLCNAMFGNYVRGWGEFDIDENGVLYYASASCTTGGGACVTNPERFGLIKLRDRSLPADKCEMMLGVNGIFTVDNMTGEIIYSVGSTSERIFCFDFCETLSGHLTFTNALTASAQTFANEWSYDPDAHGAWNMGNSGGSHRYDAGEVFDPLFGMPDNAFQRAERGKWHPEKVYVYRSAIKSGTGTERVYDAAGVFTDNTGDPTNAFTLFNWRNSSDNVDNWLNPVAITKYSPSGESVEEHDILNVHGAARLAHKETAPRLIAENANYDAVDFESFEEYVPGGAYTENSSHSGEVSYHLDNAGSYSAELVAVNLTDQIDQQGLLIKLWVKQSYNVFDANPSFSNPPIIINVGGATFSTLAPSNYNTLDPGLIHKVAQTGEWSLYQLIIDDFGSASVGDPLPITIKNNIPSMYSDEVWVDDLRVQPLDAQVTCFVYDRHTLRLIGQFDDQHFGVYSRYNGEGNLVSVLRETERGLVTVTEAQSWILTQSRHTTGGGVSSSAAIPTMSIGTDRSGFNSSASVQGGKGTDFDILSLSIGPDGPKANLFGGQSMPLEHLQELLDFRSDFPHIETEKLAALAPDLSDVERLQSVRELLELDKQRVELGKDMERVADAEKKRQLEQQREAIDKKRDAILRDTLGLSAEEIEALYDELRSSEEAAEKDN